jgi:hypothetical protein
MTLLAQDIATHKTNAALHHRGMAVDRQAIDSQRVAFSRQIQKSVLSLVFS